MTNYGSWHNIYLPYIQNAQLFYIWVCHYYRKPIKCNHQLSEKDLSFILFEAELFFTQKEKKNHWKVFNFFFAERKIKLRFKFHLRQSIMKQNTR